MRYRHLLPIAHAAIDCLLLGVMVWHGRSPDLSARLLPVAAQEGVEWQPRVYHMYAPEFDLILTGTVPAGLASLRLRPAAWNLTWFGIHEATAIAFWWLIGWWIDSGQRGLGKTMLAYLAARVLFAVLAAATGSATVGAGLQSLFWLALSIYAIFQAIGWVVRRAAPAKRTAAP